MKMKAILITKDGKRKELDIQLSEESKKYISKLRKDYEDKLEEFGLPRDLIIKL